MTTTTENIALKLNTALSYLFAQRKAWPLWIGILATIISVIGSGAPSFWGDEAATVLSATRPIASLLSMLGNIDAVHGLYYLLMHVWTDAFGSSEFAVRLPSALAAGLAAAGTAVLGRQFFSVPTGVLAGAILAVIPQFTRMGMEGRSYAIGIAASVWLTAYLVRILRSDTCPRRPWVWYAIGLAGTVYLFLYLMLLLIVHAAIVFGCGRRSAVRRWMTWSGVGLLLAAPIVVLGIAQRGQIAFLANRDYASVRSVLVGQWFGSVEFAVIAWAFIAIGVAGMLSPRLRSRRAGLAAVTAWLLAPTALLLAGNAWLAPLYSPRYLTFCLPAVALLMANGILVAVGRMPSARFRIPLAVLVVIGVAAIAAPTYLSQRGPFAKDGGSDLRQVASLIAANAHPGDAIVFDDTVRPSRKPRLALNLYPKQFAGLDDVQLVTPYRSRPALWDEVAPLSARAGSLTQHDVFWAIESRGTRSTDLSELHALGFVVDETLPVHRSIVYKLERRET